MLVHSRSNAVRGAEVEGAGLGGHHQEMPPRDGGLPNDAETDLRENMVDARCDAKPLVEVRLGGANDREQERVGAQLLVAGGVGVHVHDG